MKVMVIIRQVWAANSKPVVRCHAKCCVHPAVNWTLASHFGLCTSIFHQGIASARLRVEAIALFGNRSYFFKLVLSEQPPQREARETLRVKKHPYRCSLRDLFCSGFRHSLMRHSVGVTTPPTGVFWISKCFFNAKPYDNIGKIGNFFRGRTHTFTRFRNLKNYQLKNWRTFSGRQRRRFYQIIRRKCIVKPTIKQVLLH